jgi:hypothetical protein
MVYVMIRFSPPPPFKVGNDVEILSKRPLHPALEIAVLKPDSL